MQRFDKIVLLASLGALGLWVAYPDSIQTGMALVVMGALHLARLTRWQGHHTLAEALVWVLHVSYAFLPIGALALGSAIVLGHPTAAAQHLWMSGAIGAMTLAVMTRATLGHTGQDLVAGRATLAIYLCLFGSVAARFGASVLVELSYVSGLLWLIAFAGFAVAYGPILVRPKPGKTA